MALLSEFLRGNDFSVKEAARWTTPDFPRLSGLTGFR